MTTIHHRSRSGLLTVTIALGALISSLLFAASASAEPPTKAECIAAHETGQKHVRDGKLLAAKAQYLTCAQDSCPAVIKTECGALLDTVAGSIPSIVINAKDPDGNDVADVRVSVDGNLVSTVLDGKPISLDPGSHAMRFERAGSDPVEQTIIVQSGVQNRVVSVSFKAKGAAATPTPTPAPTPPAGATDAPDPSQPEPVGPAPEPDTTEPETGGGISPLVFVGFGVAGAGVIIGAITGAISLSKQSTLKDECPGDICDPEKEDDLNSAMTIGHVSTASFVVAGVGAAIGVIGLVIGGGDATEEGDTTEEAGSIEPLVGPGFVGMEGTF